MADHVGVPGRPVMAALDLTAAMIVTENDGGDYTLTPAGQRLTTAMRPLWAWSYHSASPGRGEG